LSPDAFVSDRRACRFAAIREKASLREAIAVAAEALAFCGNGFSPGAFRSVRGVAQQKRRD
jgi:hypothetical protein